MQEGQTQRFISGMKHQINLQHRSKCGQHIIKQLIITNTVFILKFFLYCQNCPRLREWSGGKSPLDV